MDVEIKDHLLRIDGAAVPYVATKNKGGAITPLHIVVHDTASPLTPQGDIDWLAKKSPNSSAHFVVARDAKVTQLAPTNIKTWHAGKSKWKGKANCNGFTIGIEIDNPGRLSRASDGRFRGYFGVLPGDVEVEQAVTGPHGDGFWAHYTAQQLEVVAAMCRAIVEAYGCSEIVTHWMISPGRKFDTNPLFPLDRVRELVFGNDDKDAPESGVPDIVPDATVLADGLNLRGQAQMGDNVIAALRKGTRIDVQEADRIGGWLRCIVADGTAKEKTGYVSAKFIALD